MTTWEKLKQEWKTAALAVATSLVGFWDAGASAFDWTPIVPDEWQKFVPLALGILFLLLRQWVPK